MKTDFVFTTVHKPRRHNVRHMSAPNSIRVYSTFDAIEFQIRLASGYVIAILTPDEAMQIASALTTLAQSKVGA